MIGKPKHFAAKIPAGSDPVPAATGGRKPLIESAINRLATLTAGKLEVDRNPATGQVRFLCADGNGLFAQPYAGDVRQYVRNFISQKETAAILQLDGFSLADRSVDDSEMGKHVHFTQMASVPGIDKPLRVRGGGIQALVDKHNHLCLLNNGVRTGELPTKPVRVVSQEQAIAAAKAVHGAPATVKYCELVLSPHEVKCGRGYKRKPGSKEPLVRLDPTYELMLCSETPASSMEYLVDGKTGRVVWSDEKIKFFSQVSPQQQAAQNPPTKFFGVTPDAHQKLDQQLIDYVVAGLTDPTKLECNDLRVHVRKNGKWEVAKAKSDGTWNYSIGDAEFAAVQVYVSIKLGLEIQKELGMTGWQRIDGFVADPNVQDNAYLDPQNWLFRIGVGSGSGGLRKDIAYDLMVNLHEVNGHGMVTVVTPGRDLPGSEGGGLHEKNGDLMALAIQYIFHVMFATQRKKPFSVADVQADARIVGPYTIDGGIRVQRNTKKYPGDVTGEVHDDGLIPGGACGDLLQKLIEMENDVLAGARLYIRLNINALKVVPSHKVTFVDELRGFKTADQTLYGGKYWPAIEKAHADHGIVLPSAQTKTPKKRTPAKGRRRRRS